MSANSGTADIKIVLVVRPTRLDELIARFNTAQQAQFYIEHLGADFGDYLIEHRRYGEALTKAETVLHELGRVQRLDRATRRTSSLVRRTSWSCSARTGWWPTR
jgi:hypothetical protein